MSLVPLKIPPGIYRNGTKYQSMGRWYDGSLIRFFQGSIMPVGGWVKATTDALTGIGRAIHTWLSNDGDRWAAIGTEQKLYAFNGGTLFDITPSGFTPGRSSSFAGFGYGFGPYGDGDYGDPPVVSGLIEAATWALDNWGQYLIACMSGDGRVYKWELNTAALAAQLTNAPVDNVGAFVTPQRAVVCYGAEGVPRRVKWSDHEDITEWTASATTTAGEVDVETKGKFVGHLKVSGGTLLGTTVDVHLMEFIGSPFIYSIRKVGDACGFLSRNAGVAIDRGAVWMGQNSFYVYDGSVRPLPSEVNDHVFTNLNRVQSAKVVAGHNALYNEVWWFYPSSDSEENDSYVVYNYRENHWNIGTLARTAWAEPGVFDKPLATSPDGEIFEHENGFKNDLTAIGAGRFLQAGAVEITPGNQVMRIRQILPDENTGGSVRMYVTTQFVPEGPETEHGPFQMQPYTGVRLTGRTVAPKLESVADDDWRVGVFRFDIAPGGRR